MHQKYLSGWTGFFVTNPSIIISPPLKRLNFLRKFHSNFSKNITSTVFWLIAAKRNQIEKKKKRALQTHLWEGFFPRKSWQSLNSLIIYYSIPIFFWTQLRVSSEAVIIFYDPKNGNLGLLTCWVESPSQVVRKLSDWDCDLSLYDKDQMSKSSSTLRNRHFCALWTKPITAWNSIKLSFIFSKNYWDGWIFWLLLIQSGRKWKKVEQSGIHFLTFVFTVNSM